MTGDVRELIERLENGVPAIGLHGDNETELFDIEDANAAMHEAATALSAALEREEALRKALGFIDVQISHAMLGDWSIALNCIRKLTRNALSENSQ